MLEKVFDHAHTVLGFQFYGDNNVGYKYYEEPKMEIQIRINDNGTVDSCIVWTCGYIDHFDTLTFREFMNMEFVTWDVKLLWS